MTISSADRIEINRLLISAGFDVFQDRTRTVGNRLHFRIADTDKGRRGVEAINTLLRAGLIAVIDEDMATDENKSIQGVNADHTDCWIDLVDGVAFRAV